jgi:hypothetical protein
VRICWVSKNVGRKGRELSEKSLHSKMLLNIGCGGEGLGFIGCEEDARLMKGKEEEIKIEYDKIL